MTQPPRSKSAAKGERPPLPEPLPIPVADSHCHMDIGYDDAWLDVGDALSMAASVGVDRIVQVGVDVPSSKWAAECAATTPNVLAAVAIHPNDAPRIEEEHGRAALDAALDEIETLAALERVRAVGETGLDFFRTQGEQALAAQEYSFRRHIQIAMKFGLPVMVHDRDAHDDVVRVLLDERVETDVIFHCFSGDESLARVAAEHGWFCSFAGTVTFKNAQNLRSALAILPQELILVETDAPFLTPMPYRGQPNASYLIPHTMRVMADVRGVSLESMCAAVSDNSNRVFGSFA